MAIEIRQPGLTKLYGQLGRLAGEAERARQEEEQARREASEIRQIQLRREMAQREHQWNLERFDRSQAWDIEKMEIRSRMDFEREERERQEKLDELKNKEKAIRESNILSEDEKELWLAQLRTKLPVATTALRQPSRADQMATLIQQMTGETAEELAPTGVPTPALNWSTIGGQLWAEIRGKWQKVERGSPEEEMIAGELAIQRQPTPRVPTKRKVGDYVYKGGKTWIVTGFTPEGKTIVEKVGEVPPHVSLTEWTTKYGPYF